MSNRNEVPMFTRWEQQKNPFSVTPRKKKTTEKDGGPGSGNFGHEGRPGKVGGAAPSDDSPSSKRSSGNNRAKWKIYKDKIDNAKHSSECKNMSNSQRKELLSNAKIGTKVYCRGEFDVAGAKKSAPLDGVCYTKIGADKWVLPEFKNKGYPYQTSEQLSDTIHESEDGIGIEPGSNKTYDVPAEAYVVYRDTEDSHNKAGSISDGQTAIINRMLDKSEATFGVDGTDFSEAMRSADNGTRVTVNGVTFSKKSDGEYEFETADGTKKTLSDHDAYYVSLGVGGTSNSRPTVYAPSSREEGTGSVSDIKKTCESSGIYTNPKQDYDEARASISDMLYDMPVLSTVSFGDNGETYTKIGDGLFVNKSKGESVESGTLSDDLATKASGRSGIGGVPKFGNIGNSSEYKSSITNSVAQCKKEGLDDYDTESRVSDAIKNVPYGTKIKTSSATYIKTDVSPTSHYQSFSFVDHDGNAKTLSAVYVARQSGIIRGDDFDIVLPSRDSVKKLNILKAESSFSKNGSMGSDAIKNAINSDSVDFRGSVGVLVIKDGQILCGIRSGNTAPGCICGPGGHIENGETPEQAAIRETQEEFGITPKDLVPIGNGPAESDTGYSPNLFLCTDYEGEPNCTSNEMSWAQFVDLDRFASNPPSMFQPFADSIICLLNAMSGDDHEDGVFFAGELDYHAKGHDQDDDFFK